MPPEPLTNPDAETSPSLVGSTWEKFAGNPVLGRELGTCFDMSVLVDSGRYRMWFSWRPKHGIGYAESPDGLHWRPRAEVVLDREPNSSSDQLEVTRPFVLREASGYTMWYAGHSPARVVICRATSPDGLRWERHGSVLEPYEIWEKSSLMCPSVVRESNGTYHMWYSGGERYEPDAIGYAVSQDGIQWTRVGAGPVLMPAARSRWERDRVAGAHVFNHDGYLYAAYIGFANGFEDSSIGIARSTDGIHWARHANNPVLSRGSTGDFDSINVYKPFVIVENGLWRVWFNGSSPLVPGDSSPANRIEQIGHAACRFVFEPDNADAD
jgi:beta-1,2-mannobiose phosphorylase / 1,2-beta-oligomannan phosphorylase